MSVLGRDVAGPEGAGTAPREEVRRMAAHEVPRPRSPVWWGVSVLALVAVAAGALAIVPATGAPKGLTKQKADKRYLQNTSSVGNTATVPADTGATITVLCPPGLQATDGGADSPALFTTSGDDIMTITETFPVQAGARSIGWTVEVLNAGDNPLPITAHAVCSK